MMQARDLRGDVADGEFAPDLPRGTRVTDFETMYTHQVGQEDGRAVQADPDRATRSLLAYRPTPWWRRPWAITGGVVLLGLGSASGIQRRRTTR